AHASTLYGHGPRFCKGKTGRSHPESRRRRGITFCQQAQETLQSRILIVAAPMRVEIHPAWPRSIVQLPVHQASETCADIRFHHQTEPYAHTRQTFDNAAAYVMALYREPVVR